MKCIDKIEFINGGDYVNPYPVVVIEGREDDLHTKVKKYFEGTDAEDLEALIKNNLNLGKNKNRR